MNSRTWRIAMVGPWLGLAAILFDIWRAYDQLPAVIASHFNFAGYPNGWAPKQQLFSVIAPIALGTVCLFTFLLSRFPQVSGLGWLLMITEYWSAGLLLGLTHATLRVGLGQAKTLQFPIGGWSLLMGLALVVGEFSRLGTLRKNAHAEQGTLIAEETHGSAVMASIMAALAVVTIVMASLLQAAGPARVAVFLVSVILLGCAIWAFTGFIYRVTSAGLEIRMLGVPLRFIRASDIDSYRAEECNPLTDFGGWGIRGIGAMRAYIWGGHRCVHLHTLAGDEIYLGMADPDRLVAALQTMSPPLLHPSPSMQ
jgi:hypothetical protein